VPELRGMMDGRGAAGLWAEPADGPGAGQGLTGMIWSPGRQVGRGAR